MVCMLKPTFFLYPNECIPSYEVHWATVNIIEITEQEFSISPAYLGYDGMSSFPSSYEKFVPSSRAFDKLRSAERRQTAAALPGTAVSRPRRHQ